MHNFVIKLNTNERYICRTNYWDWTDVITIEVTIDNKITANEIKNKAGRNNSKFVIRWIKDNTYLKSPSTGWSTSLNYANQFDSREDAEKYITMPDGVKYWRYCSGSYKDEYPQVSIDEIHPLNLKKN